MPMPKLVIFLSLPSRATTICVTIAGPELATAVTPAALFEAEADDVEAGEAEASSVLQIFCRVGLSESESSAVTIVVPGCGGPPPEVSVREQQHWLTAAAVAAAAAVDVGGVNIRKPMPPPTTPLCGRSERMTLIFEFENLEKI
uniref:Secreted protein n=1 Tax=Glossina pallidipes TaxID=7398 RepID=A0A1B0AHN6_GLOPL